MRWIKRFFKLVVLLLVAAAAAVAFYAQRSLPQTSGQLPLAGLGGPVTVHRDASDAERAVGLCNSGLMGFRAAALREIIGRIGNANAKGEYYLTDLVEIARSLGGRTVAVDVYRPVGPLRGAVILSHGFTRSRICRFTIIGILIKPS